MSIDAMGTQIKIAIAIIQAGADYLFALNQLKTETSKPKEPIRGKPIYAALDPAYLEALIGPRQM